MVEASEPKAKQWLADMLACTTNDSFKTTTLANPMI
jgi:hypothetical protein